MARILVTGGTGVLGRQLVPRLKAAGHAVRLTSRQPRPAAVPAAEWAPVQFETGAGLAEAVEGMHLILHAASNAAHHNRQVDVEGTRRLANAARAAGTPHLIYVSIVGIERIPLAYYKNKVSAEEIVKACGVPWTILRATQFHDLIDKLLTGFARFPLPFVFLPTDLKFQPVDEGETADELVRIAARPPAGLLPDFGGPEVLRMADLAWAWFAARGLRRAIFHLPLPGATWAGYRKGYNTCPQNRSGKITWAEWLKRRFPN